MYEVEVSRVFSAAHRLINYEGNCSRLHGHNWIVKVVVRCPELDDRGIAVDFRLLKDTLDAILEALDHRNINEIAEFTDTAPTSENIARHIYRKMSKALNDGSVMVAKVSVSESPDSTASYFE